MWGSNFASDYVGKELRSQNISFPTAEALTTEGRTDLVGFAGQQVTTGTQAQAYASYINGHLQAGRRRPDLRRPRRPAARRQPRRSRGQGRRSAASDDRRAAGQGHGDHRPARHPVQGRDAAGPAAQRLRLVDRRPDRRHRRLGGLRRRSRDDRPGGPRDRSRAASPEGVDHGVTAHPISQPAGAPARRRGSCASELGPDTDRRRVDVRWAAAPGDHRRRGTRRPRRGRGRRRRRSHPPRRGDRAFHRSPQHRRPSSSCRPTPSGTGSNESSSASTATTPTTRHCAGQPPMRHGAVSSWSSSTPTQRAATTLARSSTRQSPSSAPVPASPSASCWPAATRPQRCSTVAPAGARSVPRTDRRRRRRTSRRRRFPAVPKVISEEVATTQQ